MPPFAKAAKLGLLLTAVLAAAAAAPAAPPRAPAEDHTDSYFGTIIHDPYRWMENAKDGRFAEWAKGQDAYTRQTLDRIPGRAPLLDAIRKLDVDSATIDHVTLAGGLWFYTKTLPGTDMPKLFVRAGLGAIERVLVDPARFDRGAAHAHIDYWQPSWDGGLVAYGVSVGGAEIGVLRVVDTDSGRDRPDAIDRTYYAGPSWLADNNSFIYARLSGNEAGSPSKLYLHHLGDDPARDAPVFGRDLSPAVAIAPNQFPWVLTSPASPFVIAGANNGLPNDDEIVYAAPAEALNGGRTPWRRIADRPDHVRSAEAHGDDLYLVIAHGSGRRLVRTSLREPNLATAETIIPEGKAMITDIEAASDALYVLLIDGGLSDVRRVPWDTRQPEEVPLPFAGGVYGSGTESGFYTLDSAPGAIMIEQSWTKSPQVLYFEPVAKTTRDTGLVPPEPVDFSDIDVIETSAPAADGTGIPLSIMIRHGEKRDGSHPVLLYAYGAYGAVPSPTYDRFRRAWFDRGGIYAYAHVRGGGEYGDAWHAAGMLANKPNSISDFIASAQYLARERYGSPRTLAAQGRSAGGMVIGGAITQAPGEFAAAIISVGIVNALRLDEIPVGVENRVEFGNVTTQEGFRMLLAEDAYQHVKDGTAYPAVLLTTGLEDARVSAWQMGKFAARLQAASSSGKPVLLRLEGGHFGAPTRSAAEELQADFYAFLLWQTGMPGFQPAR